jgi:hypothetical protein
MASYRSPIKPFMYIWMLDGPINKTPASFCQRAHTYIYWTRSADPYHFHANPDPTYHFYVDPDQALFSTKVEMILLYLVA